MFVFLTFQDFTIAAHQPLVTSSHMTVVIGSLCVTLWQERACNFCFVTLALHLYRWKNDIQSEFLLVTAVPLLPRSLDMLVIYSTNFFVKPLRLLMLFL